MVLVERTSVWNRKGKRLIPLPAVVNGIFNGIERPSAGEVKYDKVTSRLSPESDRWASWILPNLRTFNNWYEERTMWYGFKDTVLAMGGLVLSSVAVANESPSVLTTAALLFTGKKVFDMSYDLFQWATHPIGRD